MVSATYNIRPDKIKSFKKRLYAYSENFSTCLCLDNNDSLNACSYSDYELVAGLGAKAVLKVDEAGNAFEQLKTFRGRHGGWMMGYFGYDLKNEIEKLSSHNPDGLNFPALYFFVPGEVILLKNASIEIIAPNPDEVYHSILSSHPKEKKPLPALQFTPRIDKETYLDKVHKIRQHIEEGDVYEMNLCMEFYTENATISPLQTYLQLVQASPVPFAAYGKFENTYHALCASPERFLKKKGSKLISQPIKGTSKRGKTIGEDEYLKEQLRHSEKDRAENVMIVDLVRNDLARSALAGTVKVEELFGIYTFPQVHQMISTISATLKPAEDFIDAIARAFPMGSMTGAPKVIAMQLIEQYEESKRGLFSGAIGYITPGDDFDFNVVIRSLLYNSKNQYLSYHVGGAITYDSVPEDEYNECVVKASAINSLWGGKN